MKAGRIIVLSVVLVLFGTWVYAADCNNGGRYEDNNDGTVTDCRTGLIWLKNAGCTDTAGGISTHGGYLPWYEAMKWVAELGNGLCGLSDGSHAGFWRLPTITEWMAMVAYAKSRYNTPALTNGAGTGQWTSGDVFTNVRSSEAYWSSTTDTSDTDFAFYLAMATGQVLTYYDKTHGWPSWPVRGGQSGTFGSLTIE